LFLVVILVLVVILCGKRGPAFASALALAFALFLHVLLFVIPQGYALVLCFWFSVFSSCFWLFAFVLASFLSLLFSCHPSPQAEDLLLPSSLRVLSSVIPKNLLSLSPFTVAFFWTGTT
jgi:hypothetical protein